MIPDRGPGERHEGESAAPRGLGGGARASRSRGLRPGRGLGLAVLLAAGLWAAPAAAQSGTEDCLACHADRGLERGTARPGRGASVFVDRAVVEGSVHGFLECVACHTTATAPHEERLARVNCAACHDDTRAALGQGIHGRRPTTRGARAVTCAACHGSHGIQPAASLGTQACLACHGAEVALYRDSVHGRSRANGSEAATCRSCHGATHTLVGVRDPRSPTYHLSLPRTCAQCHADPDLVKRYNIEVGNVYRLYMDSIHGRALTRSGLLVAANCSDCHGVHDIKRRTEPASRVHRVNVPATCGTCHAGILATYAESVHGTQVAAGNAAAPVCTGCHTAHQIRRVEAAPWQLEAIRECGTCHEESLKTYRDTFHGKVTTLGQTRVAKCSDCHGAHDIFPRSDPRSTVSAGKLVATCQRCHPAATPSFAQFDPHADPTDRERFPTLYYSYVFMTALLAGVFGFFGLHTLLWLPRSLVERLRRRRGPEAGAE